MKELRNIQLFMVGILATTVLVYVTTQYVIGRQKEAPSSEVRETESAGSDRDTLGYLLWESEVKKKKPIADLIQTMALFSEVDSSTALSIAYCESELDPEARNPKSTAKGLYQFLDGTWSSSCDGDVFNPIDNIDCFLDLYPENPGWWQCK